MEQTLNSALKSLVSLIIFNLLLIQWIFFPGTILSVYSKGQSWLRLIVTSESVLPSRYGLHASVLITSPGRDLEIERTHTQGTRVVHRRQMPLYSAFSQTNKFLPQKRNSLPARWKPGAVWGFLPRQGVGEGER